jgi:hypothetical protein
MILSGTATVSVSGTRGAGKPPGVGKTEKIGIAAPAEVDEVDASFAAADTEAVARAESTGRTASIDAITHDLATGAIDATEARRLLVEHAVAARLPPGADPALAAELRAEIEALLEADPTLARLLAP